MTMNLPEAEDSVGERPTMNRAESAGEAAMRKIEEYESASKLIKPARRGSVDKLCWDDIGLGRLLDKGSFSCVYEATLRRDRVDPAPLYAVKCLRENVTEQEDTFVSGAVDLALEATILAKLMHPNIIRLYGSKSGCISESFRHERGFFLVLDLLVDTLDKRLARWRKEKTAAAFSFRSRQNERRIHDRIEDVALGVAEGLSYIHSREIIYRDLKPHNIGFDEAGEVKIFDFGLAREVDSLGELRRMTGNAGTPRYMAPEVAKNEKYGFPSDVYSYSILLWEIVTLDLPFDNIKSIPQFNEEIARRHARPPLKRVPSPELKTLLERCWEKDQENRPGFDEVSQVLRQHLSESESRSSRFLRYRSTLSSQRSWVGEGVSATLESQDSGRKRQDSGNATQVTTLNTSSLQSSRRTYASDQDTENKSSRIMSFFPWRRKASESPESPIVEHSYIERTWVQRRLLRQPTMRLDLSSKAYPMRKYDLGRPGSFRSSGSFRSNDSGGDRPQRRRSSGKSDSNFEAMAAALAAEAKSNKKILRELKRDKGGKKK